MSLIKEVSCKALTLTTH